MQLYALGVCGRHSNDVVSWQGWRTAGAAHLCELKVVGLNSTEGFSKGATGVPQQLPLLQILVRILVFAAITAPHG